jgi:hypothetical protein
VAHGRVAGELEREQRSHAVGRDPIQLVGLVTQQEEPPPGPRIARRGGDVDAERDPGPRSCQVSGHGRGRGRVLRRRVDGEGVAPTALDDDGTTKERADRGRLDIEPVPGQGEAGQLRLEVGGTPVELGTAVDQEADDTALERDGVRATEVERGQPRVGHGAPEVSQRVPAGIAPDEQDRRYTRSREGDGELVDLRRPGGDDGERGAGDDREVGAVECLERRDAGLEDPHPADVAGTGFGADAPGPDRPRMREQGSLEVVQGRHRVRAA